MLGLAGGVVGGVVYHQTSDSTPPTAGRQRPRRPTPLGTAAAAQGRRRSVAAVAQELLPSTVQIMAEYDGQDGGATGSGFVLDRQGHVITNNHVVEEAARTTAPIEIVDQDGNRYEATVVGRSPVYDLAVLYCRGGQEARSPPRSAPPGRCTSATRSSRSARRSASARR